MLNSGGLISLLATPFFERWCRYAAEVEAEPLR